MLKAATLVLSPVPQAPTTLCCNPVIISLYLCVLVKLHKDERPDSKPMPRMHASTPAADGA